MVIYRDAKKTFTKIAHLLLIKILSNWRAEINFFKLRVSIRNTKQDIILIINHKTFPLKSER